MTTMLECGIRVTPTAEGDMVIEATSPVTHEFEKVATVDGFSEEALASNLQKIWEADTLAEERMPLDTYTNRSFDSVAYFQEALNTLLDKAEVSPEARELHPHVLTAKGMSNTDGFWDDKV